MRSYISKFSEAAIRNAEERGDGKFNFDEVRRMMSGLDPVAGIVHEFSLSLARQSTRKKEELLKRALPQVDDIQEFAGRLTVVRPKDGTETYSLDGKPVIMFMPPDHEAGGEGNEVKLVTSQKYQIFK